MACSEQQVIGRKHSEQGKAMHRTALLVVDMLTDFLAPKPGLETPTRIRSLIDNNRTVCRFARRIGMPVVFVNDAFQKTEIPIDRHFKLSIPHAIIGTKEALVVDELEYDAGKDFIVEKKLYDGFYNTRLDSILRELDVKTCVITGTWTNACVQHTAMGAFCRGYDFDPAAGLLRLPGGSRARSCARLYEEILRREGDHFDTWMAGVEGRAAA